MYDDPLKNKFSTKSNMQPIIDRNSISAVQILYGKVSRDTVYTLINYIESRGLFRQAEDEPSD